MSEIYMKEVEWSLSCLGESEKNEICSIFLSKVYASFFIFDFLWWEPNSREFLEVILQKRLSADLSNGVLDVSHFFNLQDNIWGTYLFPFIRIDYNSFKTSRNSNIDSILKQFKGVFYRHLCIMEMEKKIVVFTDISEDFFDSSLDSLEKKWYKKIELHSIIPKIIDSLSEKFESWDAEVSEMGVSFPLSMLGSHANIRNKIKSGVKISSDVNFKNLIKYGLLDFVKINSNFNISFNSDNERDKYRLYGFLYSQDSEVNGKLLESLSNFIKEIDKTSYNNGESNFVWLPIYVIAGKKSYKDKASYPNFTYIEHKSDESSLELKIEFNSGLNPDDLDNNIKWRYVVTWIYPQYLKEWFGRDNRYIYCYLKKKEVLADWKMTPENIKGIFWKKKFIWCDDFLNEIRSKISDTYWYFNEEEHISDWHNHPNLMASDLFLTATSDLDNSDYLINITNPKRWNKSTGEKLWKKISVELYKLSCFDFDISAIEKIITNYRGWKLTSLWIIEKRPFCPQERACFIVNNKLFSELIKKCSEANGSNPWKNLIDTYCKPKKYECKEYIDENLRLEDMWSLAFMELLEKDWHKTYFWWKKNRGNLYRELADIISIKEFEYKTIKWVNHKWVEINLFHMKLNPFEQRSDSVLEAAFSHYTEVVGQILEKIKSFLFVWRLDLIIQWLKQYFLLRNNDQKAPNYEIFEALEKVITENKNNEIIFNIYFPIKEKDYFNMERLDWNNLKNLWLETNWKRLKIISEVFKSNVSNLYNPNMRVYLNLGLVICKQVESHLHWTIKTNIILLKDIEKLFK